MKTELDKLKEQGSRGTHTLHKDLSLISLEPKWSGAENDTPLEECLAIIDRAALIGKWQDMDCLNIGVLRLAGLAKTFYITCLELHTKDAS